MASEIWQYYLKRKNPVTAALMLLLFFFGKSHFGGAGARESGPIAAHST